MKCYQPHHNNLHEAPGLNDQHRGIDVSKSPEYFRSARLISSFESLNVQKVKKHLDDKGEGSYNKIKRNPAAISLINESIIVLCASHFAQRAVNISINNK